ncbi:hypothetical protein D6853_04685 [Butyrivibrio sp. X503]|uniref:hypothetical protein n=1 Tax=Butyrivibrio sp. X503 TaxID=2364878 RepID=UPI000EA961EB|nr:hypothetical protein [Butyrivibrio sp. X503]RKM57315.1 hypothetical protein D6853_04685 [Butyrivibrio sp. X503]
MKKKIMAAIIAATTALSVMGCADETEITTTDDTQIEATTNETSTQDETGTEVSSESDDSISSEDSSVADTSTSASDITGKDPSYLLGKSIETPGDGYEDNVYENEFLNLKMETPAYIYISEDSFRAKEYNVSVDEWPTFAIETIESGKPVIAQFAGTDMEVFQVTIYKDDAFSAEKYDQIAIDEFKNTNGDLPPTDITSETRTVNFLGEKHDVLTARGILGEENYIANYLTYSKDGYVFQIELSGFSDYIEYFENATTLN